jgi:nitrite reductase/ring-hydroxylating ferredoxin subunit
MAEFVRVAGIADVQPGHGMVAEVNGKTVAVFNVDGAFHVVDNTCLHRGGPLGEGEVEGSVVTCPWHGWQFNVATGACVNNPSGKVAVYQVKVEGSDVKALL